MSSIPSNAMPQAGPAAGADVQEGETMTLARRASAQAGRLAGLARDNPRTAIAAGAAVAAGIATAAAIPLVRAARRNGNGATTSATEPAGQAPGPQARAGTQKREEELGAGGTASPDGDSY